MSLIKLSEEHNIEPHLLQTIVQNSKKRYQWLVRKLEDSVFKFKPEPILCLWGLAYKKGTDSLHNAHCLKVFRDFGSRASFRVYDPVAKLPDSIHGVDTFRNKWEALEGCDGLIILTEWEEFSVNEPQIFREKMKKAVVIDAVGILGPQIKQSSDINYISMGVSH